MKKISKPCMSDDQQQAGTSGIGQKDSGFKAQVSTPRTNMQVTRTEAQNKPRILRVQTSPSPQSSVSSTSKSLLLSSPTMQQIQGTKKEVKKNILIAQKPAVPKIQDSITTQNIILRAVTKSKPSTSTATLQGTQHVQSSGTKIVIPPEFSGKGQRLFFKQVSQTAVLSSSQKPVPVTHLTQGGRMISFTPQITALKSENIALRKSANSAASSNVSLLEGQYVLCESVTENQQISPSSSTSKVQNVQSTKNSPKVTPLAPPKKRKQTLVATNLNPVKKIIKKTNQKKHQIQLFTKTKPIQLPKIPTSEVAKPKIPLIQKQCSLLLSAQKTSKSVQEEVPAPARPQRSLHKRLVPLAPAESEEAAKKPRLLAPKPYVPVAMMCRLCGENLHDMIPIFSAKGTKLGLAEKISLHLPIEVLREDRLPLKVCLTCVTKLNVCHELTLTCAEVNQKLTQLLDTEDKIKDQGAKNTANSPIPLYLIENSNADGSPIEPNVKEGEPSRLRVITEKLVHVDKSLPQPEQIAQVIETVKAGLGTSRNVSLNTLYKSVVQQGTVMNQTRIEGEKIQQNPAAKKYKCFVCNDTLPSWFTLIEHQLLKFRCRTCQARFCTLKARKAHHRKTHQKKVHVCYKCKVHFGTKELLVKHKLKNHSMICECCSKIFISKIALVGHIRTKLNEKYYVCKDCGKKCYTRGRYLYHTQHNICLFRNQEKMYSCDTCSKKFNSEIKLNSHKETHMPDYESKLKFECKQCSKRFLIKSKLFKHIAFHVRDKDRPIQCTLCPKKFVQKNQLTYHMEVHLNVRKYECDHCKKKFLHRVHLVKHISNKHINTYFTCLVCNDKFQERAAVEIHCATHTDKEKYKLEQHSVYKIITPYQCSYCGNYLATQYSLHKHMKRHVDKQSTYFMCEICGKDFSTSGRLAKHLSEHDEKYIPDDKQVSETNKTVPLKRYECNTCLKKFATTVQLTAHSSKHTGIKPFKCNLCEATFTTKMCRNNHELRHRGIKKYVCGVCSKRFYAKYNLTMHERVHTKEKPYKCNFCPKEFPRKPNLTCHLRTHTGEKPYVCEVCNHGFTQKTSLDKHMCIHTQEKMYKCMYCMFSYNKRKELNEHQEVNHGILQEDPYIIKLNVDNQINQEDQDINYQIQIIESEEIHDF